jgi:hypothetical protein
MVILDNISLTFDACCWLEPTSAGICVWVGRDRKKSGVLLRLAMTHLMGYWYLCLWQVQRVQCWERKNGWGRGRDLWWVSQTYVGDVMKREREIDGPGAEPGDERRDLAVRFSVRLLWRSHV